jgi:hypothetical protein
MRTLTFLAGCISGVVLASRWRDLAKGGMKVGIRSGHQARVALAKLTEDLQDLAAEAAQELAAEQQGRGGGG